MVERIADPADQRAKLIRWTPAGGAALRRGLGVLAQLEQELAPAVGRAWMAALADTLEALIAALGRDPAAPAPGDRILRSERSRRRTPPPERRGRRRRS